MRGIAVVAARIRTRCFFAGKRHAPRLVAARQKGSNESKMRSVSIARQKVILFRERRIYIYKYRVLIKRCMRSILAFNDASEFGGFREVNEGGRRYRVSRHVSRGRRGNIQDGESNIFVDHD